MKIFKNTLHGYTLIELVVVIGVIGIMVGASIAGFNTLNKRQTVLNAGRELISIMRTAQQRAAAGIKPTGCTQLIGYNVRGTINTSDYSLSAVCSNNTIVVKTYRFATGITFSSTITTQFNGATGGASGNIGDISIRSSSYTYTLTVGAAGDISEKSLL